MGGDLFRRFFLRFLVSLAVAFVLFLFLAHIFQQRIIEDEWRDDLREQAHWIGLHTIIESDNQHMGHESAELFTNAWRKTHETIRLTFFSATGQPLADSHPERPLPALPGLLNQRSESFLAGVEELSGGGWVAVSRPRPPTFPQGLRWELVATAVILVGLVIAVFYPLVRSMTSTLQRLTEIAKQVSSGHFGRTLDIERADELGTLVHAINDMSGKLEEAEKLNTRLLHDVSHELRSPLGRIQVMAETIELRPSETEECVSGIGQEVALLDRLVGDLVETSRFDSSGSITQPKRFKLVEWSQEILHRLERKAHSRRIEWTSKQPQQEIEIYGDPQRLGQAVSNLIENAMAALEGSPGPRIEVSLGVTDQSWSVKVEDNGPGIPAADLPHIFRRFYRVAADRGRDGGGVGLGLSLARAIAEAHGGSASIESLVGQGTIALLIFPRSHPQAHPRST